MYCGALEHLRVDDVGDDRLVLAGEVFVELLRKVFAGHVSGCSVAVAGIAISLGQSGASTLDLQQPCQLAIG